MCEDQFYNERLVVEVLGVGIAVGAEVWTMTAEERTVIERGKVAEAVGRVMGGGDMAVGLWRSVREVAEMARRAVEKGESSYGDLERQTSDAIDIKGDDAGGGVSRGWEG
ncbi:hypothetical protein QJS10_CPA01g01308 [Acorus calamus]|uniref:Uncharacterized protein n=1 Tax=Acorus calamus TaxID=4465 RepID=A0AAV9FGY1_ACOCL|nr:hypothetical protein QJS10_CPA01g01308 [Acorus calamus]